MANDNSMTTKEVQSLSGNILATLGEEAGLMAVGQDAPLTASQMRTALSAALARHLSPHGGVLLVWWDPQNGLRLNPAPTVRRIG